MSPAASSHAYPATGSVPDGAVPDGSGARELPHHEQNGWSAGIARLQLTQVAASGRRIRPLFSAMGGGMGRQARFRYDLQVSRPASGVIEHVASGESRRCGIQPDSPDRLLPLLFSIRIEAYAALRPGLLNDADSDSRRRAKRKIPAGSATGCVGRACRLYRHPQRG